MEDEWMKLRVIHAVLEHHERIPKDKLVRLVEAWEFYIVDKPNNFAISRWSKWGHWLLHTAPVLANNLATGEM